MAQQYPLMPKSTAVWLVENTTLTFDQIGAFCGLHPLEIQALADGEVGMNIVGQDPVLGGELTKEEIQKAQDDVTYRMQMLKSSLPQPKKRSGGPRYTPIAKRGDKPDGISYLLKNHPELTDSQIVRLIGTTKGTIEKIRERTHINISNIKPRNPIELGLCSSAELEKASARSKKAQEKAAAPAPETEAQEAQA